MQVIYGLRRVTKYRNPVVALGVFDGVHLGHRRILRYAVLKAHKIGGKSVVVTFWPHPQSKESLYSLEHRLRLIEQLGVDICIVINFTREFARLKAADFVKNILYKKIAATYVYIGKNFRFGRDAAGNTGTLKSLSKKYSFRLKVFDVAKSKDRIISSTYIRVLIKRGDLARAQKLLERPVSILGTVIRGNFLATKLGFPTANIDPHHEVIPPSGVYAVRVILDRRQFKGICYIGSRPTFVSQEYKVTPNVEVHVFNFNKRIYRKYLEIQFIKKLRNEKKFDSAGQLVKQVNKDILSARTLFSCQKFAPQYMPS